MDQTSRRKLASQIKRDIQKHEAEITRLRDLLAYVSGEPAPAAPIPPRRSRGPSSGPTVKTYISKAFEAHPGELLGVAEIYEGTRLAGWTTESTDPQTIIRTNLRRMVAEGTLERVGSQYRHVTESDDLGEDPFPAPTPAVSSDDWGEEPF